MHQSPFPRSRRPMLSAVIQTATAVGLLLALRPLAVADEINWDDAAYVPFSVMQAVNPDGTPAWTIPTLPAPSYAQAYKFRGVVLNDSRDMLNSADGAGFMGGQWQVYIQTTETDPQIDFGGAALFMAQKYSVLPIGHGDYTTEQWAAELLRINYPVFDPTGAGVGTPVTEPLRKGDLIEVHARGGFFHKGKFNCNEQHNTDPSFDFDVVILQRDVPLAPTSITLDDVMDASGDFIFDQTRTTGAEYYQSQYVTLENVTISDAANWTQYGAVTVTDGTRSFAVKLGFNDAFSSAALPTGPLDITGIFDQESDDYTSGYRMWATSPADFAPAVPLIPGDANADGVVNEQDAVRLADAWGRAAHASWFDGDFNRDSRVDSLDAAILAAHWGQSMPEATAATVPEPNAILAILLGIVASALRRRRHGG
ncbi:MAG TPA: hypothetical protein DD670_08620 [Planctomycetaceae bacterium]|nr:hypothetical protein [Planctomycetaceae bacterium]